MYRVNTSTAYLRVFVCSANTRWMRRPSHDRISCMTILWRPRHSRQRSQQSRGTQCVSLSRYAGDPVPRMSCRRRNALGMIRPGLPSQSLRPANTTTATCDSDNSPLGYPLPDYATAAMSCAQAVLPPEPCASSRGGVTAVVSAA